MENNNLKADIIEIFSSLQGEGPFMGIKQIFVKFAKCNLKCSFCDLESVFPPKEFSIGKLLSIVKQICENSGDHHSVSLTGGEPLIRHDIVKLVKLIAGVPDIETLAMSTNAILLPEHAEQLREAGLDRVNISLDSLCPETFNRITRSEAGHLAVAGIEED